MLKVLLIGLMLSLTNLSAEIKIKQYDMKMKKEERLLKSKYKRKMMNFEIAEKYYIKESKIEVSKNWLSFYKEQMDAVPEEVANVWLEEKQNRLAQKIAACYIGAVKTYYTQYQKYQKQIKYGKEVDKTKKVKRLKQACVERKIVLFSGEFFSEVKSSKEYKQKILKSGKKNNPKEIRREVEEIKKEYIKKMIKEIKG